MKKNKEDKKPEQPYTGRTYASLLLSLASLAFLNVQKRKNNFGKLAILNICAYVVLGIITAFFIGGIIWSAK